MLSLQRWPFILAIVLAATSTRADPPDRAQRPSTPRPSNVTSLPEVAHLEAPLGAGAPVRISVRGTPGAPPILLVESRPPSQVTLELPLPEGPDAVSLRTVAVSGGAVVHVRLSATAGLADEALIARQRGRPTVVWSGVTGLRGDAGERIGRRLAFEDLTGDGTPEAFVHDISEAVRLCGVAAAPLFPRAFDPATGQLRPILLNRLRALPGAPTDLAATWTSPGPQGAPLAAIARFQSTSSSLGDGEDPMRLTPPQALADGDLGTGWAEGRGGDGRGEFVTASVSGPYRVRAVGLVIAGPGTSDEARKHGRPSSLTIVLDDRSYRVTLPDDPADHPGETAWVVPPTPVEASCLSLVLGTSLPAAGRAADGGATRIAEVRVYSDLDFGGGAAQLVADLDRAGARAEDAARLLAGMGPRAASALTPALARLSGRARLLGARVLADLHDVATVPALRTLVRDEDERIRAEAVRAFAGMGEPALPPLGELLQSDEPRARLEAARALGRLGSLGALEVLIGGAGSGSSPERRAVREAIGRCLATTGQPGISALTSALLGGDARESGARARKIELVRTLDLASPAMRELAVRALESLGEGAADFATRVQTLRLMGALCDRDERRFASELARAASTSAEAEPRAEIVRTEAIQALGRCGLAGVGALRPALVDRAPRVRAAAIEAVTRAQDPEAAAALARMARRDTWDFLRSAALEALVALAPNVSRQAVVAALGDRAAQVRRSGIRLAVRLDVRGAAPSIAARAGDANEEAEVRTEAVYALGQLCARPYVSVIKKIARMGLRRDATDAEMTAAGAAVEALGRIGGTVADEELRAARRESSPPLLRLAAQRAHRAPRCEAR